MKRSLIKLGRWAGLRARHVRRFRYRRLSPLLSVAGLGCMAVSAFLVNSVTGFLVTGLVCLVLEWRVSDDVRGRR